MTIVERGKGGGKWDSPSWWRRRRALTTEDTESTEVFLSFYSVISVSSVVKPFAGSEIETLRASL
jgi:hypothetical protein